MRRTRSTDPRPLDPDGAAEGDRDPVTQRVRVGVTGLAAVFLLTLLAASVLALLGQDREAAAPPTRAAQTAAAEEQPKEPLAELGVAPGNAPKKTPAPAAAAPAPAARVAPVPAEVVKP